MYTKIFGVLLVLLYIYSQNLLAAEAVLQDIQISEKSDRVIIQINLRIPFRYNRHFPPKVGEILQIQLDKLRASDSALGLRETLVPPPNNLVPLTNVTYEGDVPGGPYITLRFRSAVSYTVEQGAGALSVLINVKKDLRGLSVLGGKQRAALMSVKKLDELMNQGRKALTAGEHGRAIQIFNKLLRLPNHKHTRDSKELLGLARERKGQIARATLEYREYLRIYPKGEGSERVRQRLAALSAQQSRPRKKLKNVAKAKKGFQINNFGRFSQRYYAEQTELQGQGGNQGTTNRRATLTSFLNYSSRSRVSGYDIRGLFNVHDIRDLEDDENSQTRLNQIYIDVRNKNSGLSAKLGRQSSSRGGIFGRFDGALFGYQFKPKYQFGIAGGQPVGFSSSTNLDKKLFFGTSMSLGTFANHWDGNVYYIQQTVEEIIDRQAIGFDIRYSDKKFNFFNSYDFDTSYKLLNIALFRGGWNIDEGTRVNLSYSLRRNPLVFTSNALQSEGLNTFSDLLDLPTVDEDAIRAKVLQLSTLSRVLTLGATYKLKKDMQFNSDITVSNNTARPELQRLNPVGAVTTIPALDATGPDYSVSTQIVASNYFFERDINLLGIRYFDGSTRTRVSMFIRSRFPYREKWRLGPRLQIDQTTILRDNSKQLKILPSIKADYRWKKKVNFELEFGIDVNQFDGGITPDFTRTFVALGYYVDF